MDVGVKQLLKRKKRGKTMAKNNLNSLALGYAGAILSAACMLIMGVLGRLGIHTNAVEAMQQWHIFFSLNVVGIIAGIIEAAVFSFVFMYLFELLYNKLT